MLKIQIEIGKGIDVNQTAMLFQSAYPERALEFTPEFFRWRYTRCFGDDTILVDLNDGSKRIGQAVVFVQSGIFNGLNKKVGQLGDLVVHPDFRSLAAVRSIYRNLNEVIHNEGFDYIFTLPNPKSEKLNQRFLKLQGIAPLRSRFSLGWPRYSKVIKSCEFVHQSSQLEGPAAEHLNVHSSDGQLFWNKVKLAKRMEDPRRNYAVVSTAETTIIVSSFKVFGVPVVLTKGVFCAAEHRVSRSEWNALLNAAARLYRTPVNLYIGRNSAFKTSFGFQLPSAVKSSVKPLQVLSVKDELPNLNLTRIELIDMDIY